MDRRAATTSQISDLQGQQASLQAEEEKLTLASQRLQAKVDAFRTRKETLKATYTAAEAQTRIGEAVSGISEEMGDVGMAMQRAQDKTEQMQARAGALDELLATPLGVVAAGSMAVPDVLDRLDSDQAGLTAEAARRLRMLGPNAVRSHGARAFPVLGRQLRSPLLILLAVTACASFFVGERGDAVIIGVILLASVGLGFVNEYRAEKAAEALHSSIRHRCVVLRGGQPRSADVTELVPGDVIDLQLGEVVPADVRLLATAGLECEESVLTGESVPAEKSAGAVPTGTPLAELSCCAHGLSRVPPPRRGSGAARRGNDVVD